MDLHITKPQCGFCGNRFNLGYIECFSRDGNGRYFCNRSSCKAEAYKWQAAIDMGVESPEYAAYVEAMRRLASERVESVNMDAPRKGSGGLKKLTPKMEF